MKPLRNINDLQIWAKSSDYRALSDNTSIEIKLNYFGGVELGSPQDEATAVTTTPTLRWASYPGASEYKVRVWDYTGDTKGTQIVDDNTTDVEYTISSALSNSTKYLWQIAQIGPIDPIQQPITVSISGGSTLEQNGTRQLSVSTTNTNQGVTWSSQNEAIATVDSNGLVTYVSGAVDATVDIDATSVEDPTKSDTHTLTIVEESTYTAQDSRAGDEAFMQAFWDATQGDNLTVYANEGELPSSPDDLAKGKIGDNLYLYRSAEGSWRNMGSIWFNSEGWNSGNMSLADDPAGCTIEERGGELRIVAFDMQKFVSNPNDPALTPSGGNNLVGTLPPEWGNLTECVTFNIKQNHFSDGIPDTIQANSKMEWISFGGQRSDVDVSSRSRRNEHNHRGLQGGKEYEETNEFSGELPKTLPPDIFLFECRRQKIEGTIPSEWGSYPTLDFILLNHQKGPNPLGGALPTELGNLNPSFFNINTKRYSSAPDGYHGSYTGEVPQSMQDNWDNIAHITLSGNAFTKFPEFPNAKDIRTLDIEDVDLGTEPGNNDFPASYFNHGGNSLMQTFGILNCKLYGSPPETIPALTEPTARNSFAITTFQWGNNNLGDGSPLPQWIRDINHTQFNISGNNYGGGFPVEIAEQTGLRLFIISGNPFGGDLPSVNWVSDSLYEFIMGNCGFTGPIPSSWEPLSNLPRGIWRWYLNDNDLEGEIPAWVATVTDSDDNLTLERFWIYGNKFTYKDLLPTYQDIKDALAIAANSGRGTKVEDQYKIGPQKNFGDVESESLSTGQTFSFDYSHRADATDDKQWTKDNIPLSDGGRISGATTDTLTITNIESGDAGDYRLELDNSSISELGTLISNPITLTVT